MPKTSPPPMATSESNGAKKQKQHQTDDNDLGYQGVPGNRKVSHEPSSNSAVFSCVCSRLYRLQLLRGDISGQTPAIISVDPLGKKSSSTRSDLYPGCPFLCLLCFTRKHCYHERFKPVQEEIIKEGGTRGGATAFTASSTFSPNAAANGKFASP